MVKAEKWEICASYITNPKGQYKHYLECFDGIIKVHKEEGWDDDHPKNWCVRNVGNLILILKHAGQNDSVEWIQKAMISDLKSRSMDDLIDMINSHVAT